MLPDRLLAQSRSGVHLFFTLYHTHNFRDRRPHQFSDERHAGSRGVQPGWFLSRSLLSGWSEGHRDDVACGSVESSHSVQTSCNGATSLAARSRRFQSRCALYCVFLSLPLPGTAPEGALSTRNPHFFSVLCSAAQPEFPPHQVRLFDAARNATICEMDFDGPVLRVAANPARLVVVQQRVVHLYDMQTLDLLLSLETRDNPRGERLSNVREHLSCAVCPC